MWGLLQKQDIHQKYATEQSVRAQGARHKFEELQGRARRADERNKKEMERLQRELQVAQNQLQTAGKGTPAKAGAGRRIQELEDKIKAFEVKVAGHPQEIQAARRHAAEDIRGQAQAHLGQLQARHQQGLREAEVRGEARGRNFRQQRFQALEHDLGQERDGHRAARQQVGVLQQQMQQREQQYQHAAAQIGQHMAERDLGYRRGMGQAQQGYQAGMAEIRRLQNQIAQGGNSVAENQQLKQQLAQAKKDLEEEKKRKAQPPRQGGGGGTDARDPDGSGNPQTAPGHSRTTQDGTAPATFTTGTEIDLTKPADDEKISPQDDSSSDPAADVRRGLKNDIIRMLENGLTIDDFDVIDNLLAQWHVATNGDRRFDRRIINAKDYTISNVDMGTPPTGPIGGHTPGGVDANPYGPTRPPGPPNPRRDKFDPPGPGDGGGGGGGGRGRRPNPIRGGGDDDGDGGEDVVDQMERRQIKMADMMQRLMGKSKKSEGVSVNNVIVAGNTFAKRRKKGVTDSNKRSLAAVRKQYTTVKKQITKALRVAKKKMYDRENAKIKQMPRGNRKAARERVRAEIKKRFATLLKSMRPASHYKKVGAVQQAIQNIRKVKW